jgi:hypothetical protein
MLWSVVLVRTEVSEELSASFIRVRRIGELGTTLAVTSNRRTLRRNTNANCTYGAPCSVAHSDRGVLPLSQIPFRSYECTLEATESFHRIQTYFCPYDYKLKDFNRKVIILSVPESQRESVCDQGPFLIITVPLYWGLHSELEHDLRRGEGMEVCRCPKRCIHLQGRTINILLRNVGTHFPNHV